MTTARRPAPGEHDGGLVVGPCRLSCAVGCDIPAGFVGTAPAALPAAMRDGPDVWHCPSPVTGCTRRYLSTP